MLQPLPVLSLILGWKGSRNRVGTKCYTRRKIYKRIKTIYKTESEWLHFPAPFQESNRLIIISLRADNIDNYEKRNALSVVEEVEALDEEYYAAFPPFEELQSDGFLNKPLNIPDGEGGWEVKDLKLEGRPCLTYTTVPNHNFDEQEMSRSIFITPRMDNKEIFNRRNRLLEFKHGRSYNTLNKYENEAELVPYMLLHLKEVFEDISIINPYLFKELRLL